MSSQLPLNDTDFWWLRYFCGVALPLGAAILAGYSIFSENSYVLMRTQGQIIRFVSVQGDQAITIGVAYLGIALVLFGECYAQYHDKLAFHYRWFSLPGALMFLAGTVWCYWHLIFLAK